MAKGQNIGFLNFGIDGDDTEMKKKLKSIRDDVISIEKVFKNIKIDTGASKLSTDVQKAQIQADKLGISNEKLVKSIHNTQKAEEQLTNERKRGAVLEQQRAKETARAALEVARQGEVELNMLHKKAKAQQQAEISAARLEGINKRNALIGVKGQQDFKKSVDDANKSLNNQGGLLTGIEKKIIGAFSTYQLARFAKEIITVRGEFEGLELAFETMLGSADKSRKMMSEITTMALQTPYTVKDVADNVKQLIAMGIEADKVMDTMKSLGDVSAGLSVPMWRIAINYGQVATLGRLQQREIRDFAMAGVPIMEALADVLGKTKGEITEMVTAGKVGFPAVEEAFRRMAGEGGKFHNMMQKRNSTMLGQLNRLQDQIQLMMNELGKSNSGAIYSAIGAASTLVENYEKVGKVLLGLVATYGAYKGVLMASNVLMNIHSQMTLQAALSTNTLTTAQKLNAVVASNLSRTWKVLNAAVLSNPYVLAASAIGLLAWSMWELYDSTSAEEKALTHLNNLLDQVEKNKSELTSTTQSLISKINSETESINAQLTAYKKLQEIYPDILNNMDLQTFKAMNATTQMKMFVESINAINTFNTTDRIDRVTKLIEKTKRDRERGIGNINTSDILDELGVSSAWDRAKYTNAKALKELEALLVELERKSKKEEEIQKEIENTPFFTFEQQVDEAKDKISLLNKELEDLKKGVAPSTLKKGEQFDFAKGIEEKTKELKDAEEKLNWLLYGRKKETQRDFKDPLVTQLEKRIEIFKKAKTEFDKLSKTMDADSAFAKISQNPAFSGISQSELSTDGFMSSMDKLIAEASKLKVSDERDKLLANLFSLREETASKIAKEAMDAVERELNKYKDKYNLYETLLGITGSEEQSKKLVFGNTEEVIQSFKNKLKDAIAKSEDKDFKQKLQDQLFSLESSDYSESLKNIGKLISKYQTIEDKINKIKLDGVRERQKISDKEAKGELDSDLASKAIQASINKQKELISELENESLKLTPFYQKLFGDIGGYGIRMLNSLIVKTKDVIAKASEAKKVDGVARIDIEGKETPITESDLARLIKQLGNLEKEVNKSNPFKRLAESVKEYSSATTKEDKAQALSRLGESVMAAGNAVKALSGELSGMFDALGNEDLADTVGIIGELGSSLSDVAGGIMSGNYMQAASGIIKSITSIANFHDKELDKAIKRSQLEVKKLQNIYRDLEFQINNAFDGNRFKRQGELISNLYTQQIQLQKQLQAEQKKKSKDKSAIEDYKEQIREIEREVHSVMQSIKDEVYGSVQENAANLGNALVNAFRQGENAAKAWGDTVDDIVTNIVKQVAIQKYIEPKVAEAIEKYHDKATGATDAQREQTAKEIKDIQAIIDDINDLPKLVNKLKVNGSKMSRSEAVAYFEAEKKRREKILNSMNDLSLDKQGLKELEDELKDIFGGVEWLKDYLGIADSAKSTLSKGVKEITEDTANLLASYINAIRADVSFNKEQLSILVTLSQLNNTTLGQMLSELVAIKENTLNTANNTGAIVNIVTETNNIIKQVTTNGSGRKINI